MKKSSLRKTYLKKRELLSPSEASEYSKKVRDLFFQNFDLSSIKTIHTFLPISNKTEVNTWEIIATLREKYPQIRIATSKSDIESCSMTNYLLIENTIFKKNSWGVPEPQNAEILNDALIDMVLVPLLVFDAAGHRVGYGKGFYDRFLSSLNQSVVKVGLCFFEQEPLIEDTTVFDISLNYCITPQKVYRFPS